MMETFLSKNELLTQFELADFVLKTQRQIEKDFFASGSSFDPRFTQEDWSYDTIFNEVLTHLEEIMKQGETQLLQLLYQIDIPQKRFLELIGSEDFTGQLVELIIRREGFKVFLRSKF